MPADFDKCIADGGRVVTVSGPDKDHGLGPGEYVRYCYLNDKSYRGEVHKKKATESIDAIKRRIQDKLRTSFLGEQEKWSGDVPKKRSAPEGLFKDGSAQEIADWAAGAGDLKSAMAELNFFVNRAGSELDPKIKAKVERAKELVQKKFA